MWSQNKCFTCNKCEMPKMLDQEEMQTSTCKTSGRKKSGSTHPRQIEIDK